MLFQHKAEVFRSYQIDRIPGQGPDADQRTYLEMLAKLSGHRGLLQAVTHHSPLVPDQFSLSPLSLRWMRPSAPGLISPETAACSRQA